MLLVKIRETGGRQFFTPTCSIGVFLLPLSRSKFNYFPHTGERREVRYHRKVVVIEARQGRII